MGQRVTSCCGFVTPGGDVWAKTQLFSLRLITVMQPQCVCCEVGTVCHCISLLAEFRRTAGWEAWGGGAVSYGPSSVAHRLGSGLLGFRVVKLGLRL